MSRRLLLSFQLRTQLLICRTPFPGSPSMVDLDGDGLVDRLYMGDLEGKL